MKKKGSFLILLMFTFTIVDAQQEYQISQHMFSQMAYNPAYAGSQDMIELDGLVRNQWSGFPGAPVTSVFNVGAPVKPFGTQGGVGLSIVNDKVAITNQLSIAATYAYRFNIGNGKLAIGARLGFINYGANFSKLNPGDKTLLSSLPTDDRSTAFPDIDLGVYYNADKIYFGVSTVHLNSPTLKFKIGSNMDKAIPRVFTATAGYKYQLSNPLFELQPCVM